MELSGGQGTDIGWFTGVVGWIGLNIAPETADEAFTIGLEGEGLNVMTTGTGQVGQHTGSFGAIALYIERANNAFYVGRTGTFTIDDAAFGPPETCATEGGVSIVIDCTVAVGTMGGSYDFDAELSGGTGPPTYSQPQTAFDLPAIRVQVTDL